MIKYIIVDDEPLAHEIIEEFCGMLPHLHLEKNCYNAMEAMQFLNENSIDFMFLDINMPKLKGLDFLKTLTNPPKTIITTAYKEHALEGFELNVVDYLLKPFSFQRFLKAVTKVNNKLTEQGAPHHPKPLHSSSEGLFIKDYKKHYQVKFAAILFAEAYGNYVKVHTISKTVITHQTLSSFAEQLPTDQFLKVHKSFIVAKDKIDLVEGNQVHIQSHNIPIGKLYRPGINKLLK